MRRHLQGRGRARGVGSSSNALAPSDELPPDYNHDTRPTRAVFRHSNYNELRYATNTQLNESWPQNPHQTGGSDTSTHRNRVLSEGRVKGNNTIIRVVTAEKTARHRSVSLPYYLDSERSRNTTFAGSNRLISNNKVVPRSQGEAESEEYWQHKPNIQFEPPFSSQSASFLQKHQPVQIAMAGTHISTSMECNFDPTITDQLTFSNGLLSQLE